MLASLSLLALGIFGPGIATGLVSGAPQLGAGAMAGAAVAAGAAAMAVGAAATGTGSLIAGGARAVGQKAAGALRPNGSGAASGGGSDSQQPAWAKRLQRRQKLSHAAMTTAHALRGGDGGGSGQGPSLNDSDT